MQSLGHGLRHGAAHARGSQKRGVCSRIQQPLRVMSCFSKTLIAPETTALFDCFVALFYLSET